MRMTEIVYEHAQPVTGYGPGFFRLGGVVHDGPLLLTGDGPVPWAGYDDRAPLLALAGAVDVLLIGTGSEIARLPGDLQPALEDAGLGVEIMASPAACRTWNVLLTEGRRVAAALNPVGG